MFLKLSKLLSSFLNWSLKVLWILNEIIFCNHVVITFLLFRSLVLVCSRDIADVVGSSEMPIFTRLGSAKPIVFHKEGKCIYSTIFFCLRITGVFPYQNCTHPYILLIDRLPSTVSQL